ncbi:hypothetical protein TA3x_005259 [Tundrisphaera sp. TA3]|uniref:hypothetical protein n=1 Tax=Tundrisphaera sp. TA3 TaxID=3435775 RepID=UPI003EBD0B67
MDRMIGLVAYLGPETMLPMTSVIAGVVGVILMLGRQTLGLFLGLLRIKGKGARARVKSRRAGAQGPHVRIPAEGDAVADAANPAAEARSAGASSTPIAD